MIGLIYEFVIYFELKSCYKSFPKTIPKMKKIWEIRDSFSKYNDNLKNDYQTRKSIENLENKKLKEIKF